jgi:hypothetical protein
VIFLCVVDPSICSLGISYSIGASTLSYMEGKVMGATDPSSGSASVNEVVRGLGALLKKGWKPLRTILIASWDGEPSVSSASLFSY